MRKWERIKDKTETAILMLLLWKELLKRHQGVVEYEESSYLYSKIYSS